MSRITFINGKYVPHGESLIHIEDRGHQFSDGVYEVIHFKGTQFVDESLHLERLQKSLKELSISLPLSLEALKIHMHRLVQVNRVEEGYIYMQISRGIAARDHAFPKKAQPSLTMMVRRCSFAPFQGIKVITTKDQRWGRCDVKSVSLLPNVLAKQEAITRGAYEAWLVDEKGFVTEGCSTNAWIVAGDILLTAPESTGILKGITRERLKNLASSLGFTVQERSFTVEQAYLSTEAFLSSTNAPLLPIVQINDRTIGTGKPGKVSLALRNAYEEFVKEELHQYV